MNKKNVSHEKIELLNVRHLSYLIFDVTELIKTVFKRVRCCLVLALLLLFKFSKTSFLE